MNIELAELQALQLASNTRLLVVDDEPLILASLEALLKHKHYQADTALGGKLACQQLEQNHYDLVLLDLNMADVDGFAVMAFMADQGIDAAIVVVSGESTFDAVRKALRLGASDYVKKPYPPEELFSTIDSTFHKINLRVDALSAIATDSSEGASAREERLIKSNVLFSKAEQIGKLGHWEWDGKSDWCITCSEQYAKIMDMTVAQLTGEVKNGDEGRALVCEDDRERYNQVVDSAVKSEQGWDIKYSSYTKAGRRIYLHEIGNPVLDDGGALVKTIGTIQDITEISRLEEELKQSNALFHQAEAMGNMGHFFWDLTEDKLLSCSDQFARIYGKTVAEALDCFTSTEAVVNLIHPDDKERFKQNSYCYNELITGFDGEYRIITASGDTRHLYERGERVQDKDGEPSLSFGIVQDITESKQVKELLQKSNERFEMSQNFANTGSWEWDIKSGDLYWSRMISKMFGGQEGALSIRNENFISATHPDDRQLVQDAINSCIEGDKNYNIEYRVVWPDGTIRWLFDQGNVVRNNLGEAERMFGVVQDITKRKQAEMKLERAASVFTNADESIMITDANGSFTEVNDAFCRITGYTPFDVLGKNPRMLKSDRHPPEFYEDMWDTIIATGCWRGEIWNCRKNGEVYAEKMTISAIKNTEGFVHHYVSLATDITQIKAYQDQLERMAHYDPLTTLPNRVLLVDRINQSMVQCRRRNRSLAVAYLDLDGFKIVNDTHGHHLGDELLIAVSQRMKEALREGDTLARIGGDEFVAVMVDLERIEDSEPLLKRLLKAAAEPVIVGDVVMQVSVSIGVTHYPQDGADADQLIRHADQAMYIAKQAGKNRYHLFDATQEL